MEHFSKAHELFSLSDRMDGVAMALNNMANIYRVRGDIQSALLLYKESSDIYFELGDRQGFAQSLSNLAAVMIDANRLEEAQQVIDQAEAAADGKGKPYLSALKNRGILFLRKNEFERAEEVLQRVLKMTDRSSLTEYAAIRVAIGQLMMKTGRHESAVAYLQEALQADRESENFAETAETLADLGSLYEILQQDGPAVNCYKRSLKIFALMEKKQKVDALYERLKRLSERTGSDLSLIDHFLERWRSGEASIRPCR